MPAIMGPGMGTGALIDDQLIPAAVRNAQGNTIPGPQVFFVRTKGGDSPPPCGPWPPSREGSTSPTRTSRRAAPPRCCDPR